MIEINCSEVHDFEKEVKNIRAHLGVRQDPRWRLDRAEILAKDRNRHDLPKTTTLVKTKRDRKLCNLVTFVTSYSSDYSQIKKIIHGNSMR